MLKTILRWGVLGIVVLLAVIQLIPYGRSHSNPPVQQEPAWNSPDTRDLAVRACFDCHSNETVWPWYSNVAPVSWVIQSHVQEGRRELNFSEWGQRREGIGEVAESLAEREMPLWDYALFNPKARLSASERQTLILGLEATLTQGGVFRRN